ncbi:EF-hand domain-containing protein, partial [Klebsiella pneumoniae]
LERWIKGSAILGCVGCLVGHLFMFLVGGKTPDQSVHLNLTTTRLGNQMRRLDTSGDGKVSRDEFRARTLFFDLADRDGDGKLSAAEFLVIRGIMFDR